MKTEKSCGIIPYLFKDNEIYILLIKQTNGIVGFPKGHCESGETEQETALRECFEETHTKVSIADGFRETTTYFMSEYNAYKTVVFFIGKIETNDFQKQEKEISEIYLSKMDEALNIISYDDTKELLLKAKVFLEQRNGIKKV